jgi:predicted ATP-binding protein involved in virulence
MINKLTLQEFTVFSNAEITFSPGINVIIGQNGSGKMHLLKAAYLFSRAFGDLVSGIVSKNGDNYFKERLFSLFQPDQLSDLIH